MLFKQMMRFGAGILISGIVLANTCGCSKEIEKPKISRQVLLQIAIEPQVIVQSDDGGFLIVGSAPSTKQGWAAKTDAEGKVLWQYFRGLQEEDKEAFKQQLFMRPQFNGAAAMPDGSFFISGGMPHPPRSDAPTAFLTHLDANGHLLSEKFIIPEKEDSKGIKGGFVSCVRWGDGFATIGGAAVPRPWSPPTELKGKVPPQATEGWYWVVMFDGTGKKKWEKFITRSLWDPAHTHIAQFPYVANTNLMLSAANYEETEIVSISQTGEVMARNKLFGDYQFVHPVVPDDIIQIYGRHPNGRASNWYEVDRLVVITLDAQLNEVQSTKEGMKDFHGLCFRMPDQSLASFGAQKHKFGQLYTSRAIHVDRSLQNEEYVSLPHNHAPFVDYGGLAATFIYNSNQFVMTRRLMVVTNGKGPDDVPNDFKGVELDFIDIK